ncbi:MAG TPA: metallophosphoesterase family protein [Candidatus Caenarcaniphilales bacterium]|nr:metallophosphoesterase family protein [Candidatus Caenarcaniphilales bacterium]
MRIAVLSDIHGNLPALEAILEAVAPYDMVWQLGDVVGYGPQPDEVVERLAAEAAVGVRGNHDSAALGDLPTDAFNDDARSAVEWTAERLAPTTRTWLAALPRRRQEEGFTLTHGSPRDPTWEYVVSSAVARANFPAFFTEHCLVGHTHIPLVFRDADGRVEEIEAGDGCGLELDARRTIINPGSVGQPRDGDPRACAMLLDTEARTLEWRRVEYAIERVQKLMVQLRLPPRLVTRLTYGL